MDKLEYHGILKFRPDTLEAVRKDINLNKRQIDESLDLLEDWLKKQAHFVKKEYSRHYLELTLITCKGSLERSKQRLDHLATFKTLMPEFYESEDMYKDYETINEVMHCAPLPQLTPDQHRVCLLQFTSNNIEPQHMSKIYKHLIMIGEHMKRYDYVSGFAIVLDCRFVNPMNVVTAVNPMSLKKIFSLVIEGYGMRLKGIHFITTSKLIDALISIFKQVLSAKLRNRIYVHQDLDVLHKTMTKEIFPNDFGGQEKSLKELHKNCFDVLTTEDNLKYFNEMKNAATVEAYRQTGQFNEQYIGTPGSFRMLNVD